MIQVLVEHEDTPDYMRLFARVAVLMMTALILLVSTVKEKKLAKIIAKEYPDYQVEENEQTHEKLGPEVRKSLTLALMALFFYYMAYNGITTAFSRYAQEVWGLTGGGFAVALMVVAVSAFASYIPLGALASKIGRKKVIAIGFWMMLVTFVVMSFISVYHWYINLWFIIVGVGGSAVGVNIFPVIVDMCSHSELGKYTGLYYTFSMAAQIITPIASGFLLDHISYRTLFPYAAMFTALGILVLRNVHHGDCVPEQTGNLLGYLDN